MKRALFTTVGLLVALSPVAVEGQLYNGSSVPLTAEFQFVSGSPGITSTSDFSPRVRVGPYTGNFVDDVAGSFTIYCVDYLHYARSLDQVNVTGLDGTHGSLANTRLNDAVSYQKAAYLSSLFEDWESYGSSQQTVWSGIHAAIWEVTSGESLGDASDRQTFVDMANANYGDVDMSEWYVITNTDLGVRSYDGTGQEFLMRRASVPEPATLLLMITGLVMLVGVSRKRSFALQDL